MSNLKISRRNFLQLSALTASGAIVAACGPAKQVTAPTQAPAENTPVPQPTAPPTKAPVTMKWWDFPRSWAPGGSAEQPNFWNEELVKQYQAENPNVTIEFTGVSWSDGPQKLDVALAADQAPDVMYGYPALFGKCLSLNVLQPLDDYIATMMDKADYDDFYKAGWDFVTVQGQKYAFPWYYGSEGEWAINTTIAKEAGAEDLIPQAPSYAWTPDQFLALAKKCTFKRANGDQVWGTVIWTNEQQGINLWGEWSYPYMFGAKLYSEQDKKSDFGSAEGVKSFQFMYDMVETYKVAPPGAAGLTGANMDELWNRKQNTVRVSSGVDIMNGLKAALDAGTIQAPFEVLPVLPPVESGLPLKVNGGIGVQMVFTQKDANKAEEVFKCVQWLTNAKNMEVFTNLSKLCARISTTKKIAGDDPLTKWRIDNVLPNLAPYSKNSQDLKIDDAWMQALQAMYDGKNKPAEAAKWFQDEANKLLQES